ncbi:MAG: universal stress protein [Saprospiraceae bacterium]|nr:universal stress protein [Candidatus Vicinibacter affinis]
MGMLLCPVDFSESSKNSLNYGIATAQVLGYSVHVLYVFQVPVASSDAFVFVPSNEELESMKNSYEKKIEEFIMEALSQYPSNEVKTSFEVRYGDVESEILDIAESLKIELIIMGIQGKGFLTEKLIGSTATRVLSESAIPTLVVPASAQFEVPKSILFAYDNKGFTNKAVLKPLLWMAKVFDSNISVVTVFEEIEQFPEMASSLHKESLQPALESYEKTSYHVVQNRDFVEGVKLFLKEHPCDIIYLISRKHNFWTSLFKEKHAKEMAFHGDIPILSNLEC